MSVSVYGLDYARTRRLASGDEVPTITRLTDDPDPDAEFEHPLFVNWSNVNARAMLALLGLTPSTKVPGGTLYEDELSGSVPLPEARRAVMRARARFGRMAPELERAEEIVYGEPREAEPGVVELRPVRVWSGGIHREHLAHQLERVAQLIEFLKERGATHLAWG